jgi:hypothetical protein
MKKIGFIAPFLALALPAIASAQVTGSYITSLIALVGNILNMLIPILIALALVTFFWGLVRYVWSGGEDHANGRNIMIAGLVALFVMVSVWGIIRLAQNTLGISSGNQGISAPTVPGVR